jgi:branched-chain amino acid transport system substrate-binding protein
MGRRRSSKVVHLTGLAALACSIFLPACGRQASPSFKVGALFSQTGPQAPYGKKALDGVRLAVEQQNSRTDAGGLKIDLLVEDTGSTAPIAIAALEKLISVHRVAVVIGPESSSLALACAPVANNRRVVLFAPTISADAFSLPDAYTFRNWPSARLLAGRMAVYAAGRLGYRRIAVLYVQNDMGVAYQNAFRDEFQKLGGQVTLAQGYAATEQDFRTLLLKAQATSPHALYLIGQAELGRLLRQKAELGIKLPVISGIGIEDPKVREVAGDEVNGISYTTPVFNTSSSDQVIADYEKAFEKRFGHESDIFAATSYDAANLVIAAVIAGHRTADEIKQYLHTLSQFHGVTGEISIDRNGDVLKRVGVKKFVAGKPTMVEEKL